MKINKTLILILTFVLDITGGYAQENESFSDKVIEGRYINEFSPVILFDITIKKDTLFVDDARKKGGKMIFLRTDPNSYQFLDMTGTFQNRGNDLIFNVSSDRGPELSVIKTDISLPPIKIMENVMVPMSDGVNLASDIYMPENANGPLPVIIIRTPYNKEGHFYNAHAFAEQNFVVITQDVRGKHASEGKFLVQGDRQDYYEVIDWASKQPWSNGNIGTFGCSYSGENQLLVATLKHPAHKAIISASSGGAIGKLHDSRRMFGYYQGGANALVSQLNWFNDSGTTERDYRNVLDSLDRSEVFQTLPIVEITKKYNFPETNFEDFITHKFNDPWWDQFGYINSDHTFNTPALLIDAWFDQMVKETTEIFTHIRENSESSLAGRNQFLILAPGQHCNFIFPGNVVKAGNMISRNAGFPYFNLYVKWYNHWLRENQKEDYEMSPVQYFTTGSDQWKKAEKWPPSNTEQQEWYLHSNGNANTRNGDGKLQLSQGKEVSDHFIYDPMDPVPSGTYEDCCSKSSDALGSYDQSEIELRPDILVYTSAEISKDLTITGNISVDLFVSSSAKDTDFTVKLVEVYPDGRAMNLKEAILRARYRKGFEKEVFFKENEIEKITLDLHAISHTIKKGHRIRLEVSSSNFPRFDRNLNTGNNNYDETIAIKATNTVWLGGKYPSVLHLPVVIE